MLKKLVVAVALVGLNFAHADTSIDKFNIESAMTILKDAEAAHIEGAQINEFANGYGVVGETARLANSYANQGLKFSDFEKRDYGVYALKKHPKTSPTSVTGSWKTDMTCHSKFGAGDCETSKGNTCYAQDNGDCV